jgi:N-acetylmuramoyl-L-alanine amidase
MKQDPYKEQYRRSPNQSGRIKPKFIVIHDSCGSHDGTKSWILQDRSNVSYHYLIDKEGNRTQFVYDTKKAWACGKSVWKGFKGLNSHSVSCAFWGDTHDRTPSDAEIDSMAHKCVYLMDKFDIGIGGIITHAMISPGRKTDTTMKVCKMVIERVRAISRS